MVWEIFSGNYVIYTFAVPINCNHVSVKSLLITGLDLIKIANSRNGYSYPMILLQ